MKKEPDPYLRLFFLPAWRIGFLAFAITWGIVLNILYISNVQGLEHHNPVWDWVGPLSAVPIFVYVIDLIIRERKMTANSRNRS